MSVVTYGAAANIVAGRPSPKIWRDCSPSLFLKDPGKGKYMFDDFVNSLVGKETASGTDFTSSIGNIASDITWYVYADSTKLADVAIQADVNGVLMLDQDGTDDDNSTITTGGNITGSFVITTGQTGKFWYECRLKISTITTTDIAFFAGLTEEAQAASLLPLLAAGALADKDHIGFHYTEAATTDIASTFTKAGQTDGGTTGVGTIAVDTYIQLGMKYNPGDNKLRFFANGVENTSAAVLASASNFPSGEALALTFCLQSGAAGEDADNMKIDWVRCAQEF